jgi:hypothetical protein
MYQKGVIMKKLSKSLVKQLIYEAMAEQEEEFYVTVKNDNKGRMKGSKDDIIAQLKKQNSALQDDDIEFEPLEESIQKISTTSIDKMVREEVSRYYGEK